VLVIQVLRRDKIQDLAPPVADVRIFHAVWRVANLITVSFIRLHGRKSNDLPLDYPASPDLGTCHYGCGNQS
jgi:hypothetical protein